MPPQPLTNQSPVHHLTSVIASAAESLACSERVTVVEFHFSIVLTEAVKLVYYTMHV